MCYNDYNEPTTKMMMIMVYWTRYVWRLKPNIGNLYNLLLFIPEISRRQEALKKKSFFLLICGESTDTNIPVNLVFIKHFVLNSWISFGFKVSNSGSGVWQFPLQARV